MTSPRPLSTSALGALLAAAAGLLACAHGAGGRADANAARVEGVRARFTPGDRADVDVELSIAHRGAGAATVSGIEWEVWLEGRRFAAGTLSLSVPLPLGTPHRFTATLPIVFRRAGSDSTEAKAVEIGVRGQLLLGVAGRVEKVPFQDRRRIVAANLPEVGGSIDQR